MKNDSITKVRKSTDNEPESPLKAIWKNLGSLFRLKIQEFLHALSNQEADELIG